MGMQILKNQKTRRIYSQNITACLEGDSRVLEAEPDIPPQRLVQTQARAEAHHIIPQIPRFDKAVYEITSTLIRVFVGTLLREVSQA